MARLLYVRSSPRGERSYSARAAEAFLKAYRASHPGDEVQTLDVFTAKLPVFDGFALQAKYAILNGQKHTAEEAAAWKAVEEVIGVFKSADKYLFAVPMWNFGIPYRLKQYLDVIIQPGYTFSYSPTEGYKGLVAGRPAACVYARGGAYPEGSPEAAYDFQKKYFELALGFMGITDVKSVVVEPTLVAPEAAKATLDTAVRAAEAMARVL